MTCVCPTADCPLCPRLAAFRDDNRLQYPAFFNAPVPSFGALTARLLVVGLAPGLKGANRSGRPFTGDYAGLVLYSALSKHGFAQGEYDPEKVANGKAHEADGFHLLDCRITNAVRCVPQENKPETSEIRQCNGFLKSEIAAMPNLEVILSLGLVSHKAVLMALGLKQSAYAFKHGAQYSIGVGMVEEFFTTTSQGGERGTRAGAARPPIILLNSYHCSRYNINTGALTQAMFDEVVEKARAAL
jgi:uracil-DNA glycosylase